MVWCCWGRIKAWSRRWLSVGANVESVKNVGHSIYCKVERFSSTVPVSGVRYAIAIVHPDTSVDSAVVKGAVVSKV